MIELKNPSSIHFSMAKVTNNRTLLNYYTGIITA